MCAFDKEKPYQSDFFVNSPVAWHGYQEYKISLSKIMMRISHLLILRLIYPKSRDLLVICKHYVGKVLLLAAPPSSWLDAVSEDCEVDDVTAAHFCIGQQTLLIVKKLGMGILQPHNIIRARLVSLVTSNRFMGATGSIVDLPRSSNNHLNRYAMVNKFAYINGLRKILGEYIPEDLPETTRKRWADQTVSELVDRTDFNNFNALRKVSAYVWNKLLFTCNKKRKRNIASLGGMGLSPKFLELLDELTRDRGSTGNPDRGEEGSSDDHSLERSEETSLSSYDAIISADIMYRQRRGSERSFSSPRLSHYLRGCIEQLKHAKINAIKARKAISEPYPQASIDLVLERYVVSRQEDHIICRSNLWRHKQCAYCGDVNPPASKELQTEVTAKDPKTQPNHFSSDLMSSVLSILVCESCCRPFHQQCLPNADGNPRVLLGDIRYRFICRDCSVFSRYVTWPQSQYDGVQNEDLFREVVERSGHTLLDAAVIALSILTVNHKYKYNFFDLRAVWSIISQMWQHMQPMVMHETTDMKCTTFINEPTIPVPLTKQQAQGRLITMLRNHPAFAVKDTVPTNTESSESRVPH